MGQESIIDLLQQLLNVSRNGVGLRRRRVTLDDLSLLVHKELGKVPLDSLRTEYTGLLVFQEFEHLVRLCTVHVRLSHDRETHAIVLHAEAGRTLVILRVLARKLIAREAKDL